MTNRAKPTQTRTKKMPKRTDPPPTSTLQSDPYALSAKARRIVRAREAAAADLELAGGAYALDQVRTLLDHADAAAIDRMVAQREILAVPGRDQQARYPAIQFNDDGSIVDGLKAVLVELDWSNGWAVLNYLVHPSSLLDGETPISALRAGRKSAVIRAVRHMGELGR